ncbi:MAG: hypothetical protein ACTHVE_12055, partial [Senegalia sp. (in: firmicutes)]|uniref:hypothetical protein n=1 Tax=Senegalia sp. (in: firmicutes) TaxID=1924098 RepID=UPI003F95AE9B
MGKWNPYWTEEVKIESGGRYPLGLNNFHNHLEEYLIKGIVSTTDRLRYISYCCWAIGDIEYTMDIDNYYEFEEAFRRRESALALGFYLSNPESSLGKHTIYGIEAMKNKFNTKSEKYNCSFKILPSQKLGAFGQYYKGTMQNWGLIYVNKNGLILLTESGKRLHKIMDHYYSQNEYYINYKGKKEIPKQVLISWGKVNIYDNIRDKTHSEEREFYKDVLFHLNYKKNHSARRDSFVIYLECIIKCNNKNIVFDEDIIRNSLYYKKIKRNNRELNIKFSHCLEDTVFYWTIYEIQVYFRWYISELFRFILMELSRSERGLAKEEILKKVKKDIFDKTISDFIEKRLDYYEISFIELYNQVQLFKSTGVNFLEDILCEIKIENITQVSAYFFIMLSLLYDKYLLIKDDSRFIRLISNKEDDYCFYDIFQKVNLEGYKLSKLLENIIDNFIINKHDENMYRKKDLRKCWFTKSKDKYHFHSDSRSIWRPAKHQNIYNFLFDMR